jgi:hypothetical protein
MRSRILLLLLLLTSQAVRAQAPAQRWYRGNTHAHTLNSDGDSPPDEVVRWYREHGYQFTFITDHEFITDVAPLNAMFGAAGRFLVISGQEITQRVADATRPQTLRQPHVNALGITRVIRPMGDRNIAAVPIAQTYARHIPAIRAAGGVAQVNHPNFAWSVTLNDMLQLPDSTLLEIWNAHVLVNNLGGTDSTGRWSPSHEALWDSLLTRGKVIFGVADDDSHSFRPQDAEDPGMTRPGRAWVMVRADTLTPEAILRSLSRGDFYSSNGVRLRSYEADANGIRLEVEPAGDRRFQIEFIGQGGQVLATASGTKAQYRLTGNERYVRVRITDSEGRKAWTQPVIARR